MSNIDFSTVKSLLHFEFLQVDEIGLERWSTSSSNVKTVTTQAKFGDASLYSNGGNLISTNETGIWSLNSSGNYEVEFFVYLTAHGGNRYLFQLTTPTSNSAYNYSLRLSFNSDGTIRFASDEWGYSNSTNPINGATILELNTWHHVMFRVSSQKAVVFLDGAEEISAELPENVTLGNTQARVGYFSSTSYKYYIDEFVFRHSAGTGNPTIPDSPYINNSELIRIRSNIKSLLHFEDLTIDEVSSETWSTEKSDVVSDTTTAKFGSASLYPSTGALICTNNTGIWNLNSNGEYEIEFFVYPVAHGDTRRLLRLFDPDNTSSILMLSLTNSGCLEFVATSWEINTAVAGTTALTINYWNHVVLRISNQKAVIFLNRIKEISVDLPDNVTLNVEKASVGYFSSNSYIYYMDEFVLRYSAGRYAPIAPTSPYSPIPISSKRNFGSTKCLLHFDFPYFNEPNDGLDDDVGIETWSAENTNVKLYGSKIPKAGTFAPKFGYRCLRSYKGAVIGTNNTGIWNLNSNGNYEIEFFVNSVKHGDSAGTRRLLRLREPNNTTSILMLSLTTSGYLELTATGWNITDALTGTTALTIGEWHHILIRVSNQTLKVYLDGVEEISSGLPNNVTLNVDSVMLGYFSSTSYPFYIDEFVFRHSARIRNPKIPTKPYSAKLDVESIGGYGSGEDGDISITEDTQINSYGAINTVTDATTFSVSSWSNGDCIPEVGREVMIHITSPKSTTDAPYPRVGLYAFSRIASIDGLNVVLADEFRVTKGYGFTLSNSLLDIYNIQIITIPHYNSLQISSKATITPLSWTSNTGGGIVAFRVKGNCTIDGEIITHGYGAVRYDFQQMTNSKLIDRFLCSQGGGIFITCGGTFSATSTARLGATWSGLGNNKNGAAGYGGNGGSVIVSSATASGGTGGVGGGGGGGAGFIANNNYNYTVNGGSVGSNGASSNNLGGGGGGGCSGIGGTLTNNLGAVGGNGGCQGSSINGKHGGIGYSSPSQETINRVSGGAGGGAPGGNAGQGYCGAGLTGTGWGVAGDCIILICEYMSVSTTSISTGGSGSAGGTVGNVRPKYYSAGGGGGTGFCYIACRKQVS